MVTLLDMQTNSIGYLIFQYNWEQFWNHTLTELRCWAYITWSQIMCKIRHNKKRSFFWLPNRTSINEVGTETLRRSIFPNHQSLRHSISYCTHHLTIPLVMPAICQPLTECGMEKAAGWNWNGKPLRGSNLSTDYAKYVPISIHSLLMVFPYGGTGRQYCTQKKPEGKIYQVIKHNRDIFHTPDPKWFPSKVGSKLRKCTTSHSVNSISEALQATNCVTSTVKRGVFDNTLIRNLQYTERNNIVSYN